MSDDDITISMTAVDLKHDMLERVRRYQRHPLSKRLMLKSMTEAQLYEIIHFLQSFKTTRD